MKICYFGDNSISTISFPGIVYALDTIPMANVDKQSTLLMKSHGLLITLEIGHRTSTQNCFEIKRDFILHQCGEEHKRTKVPLYPGIKPLGMNKLFNEF